MKAIIGLFASEFNELVYRFDKELQNEIKIRHTNETRKPCSGRKGNLSPTTLFNSFILSFFHSFILSFSKRMKDVLISKRLKHSKRMKDVLISKRLKHSKELNSIFNSFEVKEFINIISFWGFLFSNSFELENIKTLN